MPRRKEKSSIQPPAAPGGKRTRLSRKKKLEVANKAAQKTMAELELSPQHQALLRREAYLTVLDELQTASDVLAGKETWNANQVRLFGMLLNKVMPDLKYSKSEVDHNYNTNPEQLTREQLEAIVIESRPVIKSDEDDQ